MPSFSWNSADTNLISTAVAPGVALTSSIFFTSGLQARFTSITGRVRDLAREARLIRTPKDDFERRRIQSIRHQIDRFLFRVALAHRAIMMGYGGTLAFGLTMLVLLSDGFLNLKFGGGLAVSCFAAGLGMMVLAVITSLREVSIARVTVEDDVRSSLDGV